MRRLTTTKKIQVLDNMEMTDGTNMTIGSNLKIDGNLESAVETWLSNVDNVDVSFNDTLIQLSESTYVATAVITINEDITADTTILDTLIFNNNANLSCVSNGVEFTLDTSGEIKAGSNLTTDDTYYLSFIITRA